jgi:hypothetical protein
LNLIALPSSAWVPTTMSTLPSASPFLVWVKSLVDTSREACATLTGKPLKRSVKVRRMLARQQRGRHHDRDLLAFECHGEGRAQRHLGLAEADVAADQPVHRTADLEVLQASS